MSDGKGTLDRFRALEDASGAPLDESNTPLAADDDATFGLPFVRCAVCHVDAHRLARECGHCGADLTTEEQRAFLQSFAADRKAQAAALAAEAAPLAATQRQAVADASALRLGDALAAQAEAEEAQAPPVRIRFGPGATYVLRAVGGTLLLVSAFQAMRGRFWLSIPLFLVALGCSVTVLWLRSQGRT